MTARHLGYSVSTAERHGATSAGIDRPGVTTRRSLLTSSWTSDVSVLEAAVARFNDEAPVANDCQVAFFEISDDEQLHVNVTHAHPTRTPPGWIGPGKTAGGFVYNRRFSNMLPRRIAQYIHDMVFAARC